MTMYFGRHNSGSGRYDYGRDDFRATWPVTSLAPVVQRLDSAIHRINPYPADKYYGNQLRYPLDSDLSGG